VAAGYGEVVVSAETSERLRYHADFDYEGASDSSIPSVSSCTYPGEVNEGRLDEALSDLLDALEGLNRELNGPAPSENAWPPVAHPSVSTAVAYYVAVVTRMIRSYGERHSDPTALRGAWLVETAWEAVLAGDIDDIKGHLAEEERVRG
jgi:hypothetical protein